MATKLVRALVTGSAVMLIALPVAAATVSVGAGDNLQAAIDKASAGDTILVHAGATFIGNFVVRAGKRSITIRSSAADTNLPGPGQRTGPEYWQYLPKLQSPNTLGALSIEPGASYITIENVEFLPSSNGSSNVIELGYADSRQTSLDVVPQHIVLDRILLNVPEGVPQKRGIALNSGDTTIKNSYLGRAEVRRRGRTGDLRLERTRPVRAREQPAGGVWRERAVWRLRPEDSLHGAQRTSRCCGITSTSRCRGRAAFGTSRISSS